MTPSQSMLKAYIASKVAEGAFAGLTTPGEIAKKAVVDFASDMLHMGAESGITAFGQAAVAKLEEIAKDVGRRGLWVVYKELKNGLDMQHQRGVERLRRKQER